MFGLPNGTIALLQDYFSRKSEIQEVRVYGSRAMGTAERGSDIDLAIWTTAARDLSAHIQTELEELPTPYLFDVTDYQHLSHLPLKAHIDRVGKVLFVRNR